MSTAAPMMDKYEVEKESIASDSPQSARLLTLCK